MLLTLVLGLRRSPVDVCNAVGVVIMFVIGCCGGESLCLQGRACQKSMMVVVCLWCLRHPASRRASQQPSPKPGEPTLSRLPTKQPASQANHVFHNFHNIERSKYESMSSQQAAMSSLVVFVFDICGMLVFF